MATETRPRFGLRLRTAMIGVAVLAGFLAWLRPEVHAYGSGRFPGLFVVAKPYVVFAVYRTPDGKGKTALFYDVPSNRALLGRPSLSDPEESHYLWAVAIGKRPEDIGF